MGLSLLLWGVACRRLFLVLCINREKQEVIKSVLPIVAMFAEIEVDLCRFRQPESCILLEERHRAIFHCLVLAEQLDFRHGFDHVGFDPHDLKLVGGNPRPAFQIDGEKLNSPIGIYDYMKRHPADSYTPSE